MRVLFADPIGHLLGEHDREICRGLSGLGHQVVLVTNSDCPHSALDEPYELATLYGGCVGDRPAWVKGAHLAAFFPRLWAKTRTFRPDVVILYYSLNPRIDRLLLQRFRSQGLPVVLCVHDVLPLEEPGAFEASFGALYREAWRIVAFSAYSAGVLTSRMRMPTDVVRTLYFGVDRADCADPRTARQDARRAIGAESPNKVILCFGQIKKNKDLYCLLHAFKRLLESTPLARLAIVGRPQRDDIAQFPEMARDLGLGDRVHFALEHVPECEIPGLMLAADVVVTPYSDLYQSAVLPMACLFERPIVATTVGNVPEVLRDGESGYLVVPGDIAAMHAALLEVLGDEAEACRRGKNAARSVRTLFSWKSFCAGLSDVLGETNK